MNYRLNITSLEKPEDVKKLMDAISEISEKVDISVVTTAPNGTTEARKGKIVLYDNSGVFQTWINTDGVKAWTQLSNQSLWEVDGSEHQLVTADAIDMQTNKIINVTDPTSNQDAATKKYVDDNTTAETGTQIFTSSGTFTVPSGITTVYITMVAGGAGGGGGTTSGGGGGAGEWIINEPLTVTPSAELTVTIGAGGDGGSDAQDGNDGADTVFDSLTVAKGLKGTRGSPGVGGNGGATSDVFDASGTTAGSKKQGGGNGADSSGNNGGGGGGSRFGSGGAGGASASGSNATGNGGGGGGGGGNGTSGGNGTIGFCLVMW